MVSIVLPTWNRERFLAGAFESITAQTCKDWELIVVDDGSTDNTRAAVESLVAATPGLTGRVRYIYQDNAGPGAARRAGILRARGKYLGFFDSDDLWLPHHVGDCVEALEANPDVDWVFGAGRRVDLDTGEVVVANSFTREGGPRPFIQLAARQSGRLRIPTDPRLMETVIDKDHCGGLQASVIRATLFEKVQIPDFRIGEDYVFTVTVLAAGGKLAYLEQVHVVYRMHTDQTSSAGGARGKSIEKRIHTQREYLRAIESMVGLQGLKPAAQRALSRRLAHEYFWCLGYSLCWQTGRTAEAIEAFEKGLAYTPWSLSMRKAFAACKVKRLLRIGG
jgi:GT2 family glycosyltransferase